MQRRPGLNVAASYTHVCGFHTHTHVASYSPESATKKKLTFKSNPIRRNRNIYIGEHSAHILVSFRSHTLCVRHIYRVRRSAAATWHVKTIVCNFMQFPGIAKCGMRRLHVGFATRFAHAGFLICTQFGGAAS